jgi:hypothetical protein
MTTQGETTADTRPAVKLTLMTLTAMVVGSMVGAGVFSLPRRFADETGVAGALIAWTIAGTGMLMLAFVFQSLAVRRPDLDAGVYAYAKAGFGEYLGFFAAFGCQDRAQARRQDRRWPRFPPGADGRRRRHPLHGVPALRGRAEIRPRLLHHLRARHAPLREGPQGTGKKLFSPAETVICAVSVAGAVLGVVALAAGSITL